MLTYFCIYVYLCLWNQPSEIYKIHIDIIFLIEDLFLVISFHVYICLQMIDR